MPTHLLGEEVLPGPTADGSFRGQVRARPDRGGRLARDRGADDQAMLAGRLEVPADQVCHVVDPRAGDLGNQLRRRGNRNCLIFRTGCGGCFF